jgi:hypothetical protein
MYMHNDFIIEIVVWVICTMAWNACKCQGCGVAVLMAVAYCPEQFTSEQDVSGFSLSCYRFQVHFLLYQVAVKCSTCHRKFL